MRRAPVPLLTQVQTEAQQVASLLLDGQHYLAHNPDVAAAGSDPLTHYVLHGASERRWPAPIESPEVLAQLAQARQGHPDNRLLAEIHLFALLAQWHATRMGALQAWLDEAKARGWNDQDMADSLAEALRRSLKAWVGCVSQSSLADLFELAVCLAKAMPEQPSLTRLVGVLHAEVGDVETAHRCFVASGECTEAWPEVRETIERTRQCQEAAQALLARSISLAKAGDASGARQSIEQALITHGSPPYSDQARQLGLHPADRKPGLLLLDSAFPAPFSPFRHGEFSAYMREFESCVAYTKVDHHLYQLSHESEAQGFRQQVMGFAQREGVALDRLGLLHPWRDLQAQAAYCVFLNQADLFFQQMAVPAQHLAFTLYPGGGFELQSERSDALLKRLMNNPRLDVVVTTQRTTYEYLLEGGYCSADRIEHIYGGLVPTAMNPPDVNFADRLRARAGRPLRVCFVAHRYTATGAEKGYDVFVQVAQALRHADDVEFHVVGGFGPEVLDLAGARVHFHGPQPAAFFGPFYREMDIILSPNAPLAMLNRSSKGSFDGFPTGAVLEAGLHGVAMFMTDFLGMNRHIDGSEIFRADRDAVIIERDVDAIVSRIRHFIDRPEALVQLAAHGREVLCHCFGRDYQMPPRLALMRRLLA